MVKPPKTMQPEAVNLREIEKKGTRGMGGDDFRNYMARKIDLQRQQFGNQIPQPPPPSPPKQVRFAPGSHNVTTKPQAKDMSSLLKSLKKRHGSKKSRKRVKKAKRQKSSKFDADKGNQADLSISDDTPDDHSQHATKPPTPHASCLERPSPGQLRQRPDLFLCGVVVMVNGYTSPDADTLMRLLHKHGGDLEKYETSRVTHIIAEHLSAAKATIYKKQKRPRPVCRPEWIVDSVQAKRLLPHGPYLIQEVQPEATCSVKNFFTKAGASGDNERDAEQSANKSTKEAVHQDSPLATSLKEASLERRIDAINVDTVYAIKSKSQESGTLSVVSDEDPSHEFQRDGHETLRYHKAHHDDKDTVKSDDTNDPMDDKPSIDGVIQATRGTREFRSEKEMLNPGVAKASLTAAPQLSGTSFPDGRIRTVGTDPNFLDSYFKSSRLSFIGSFQQRARQSPTKKATAKRPKTAKRFVFLVDMDSFFASVVLRNYPQYREKPVAISHLGKQDLSTGNVDPTLLGNKDSTSECATCNYKAREYGVEKGMFLGRARELCPDLVVLQYDFEGYEEVSEQVADILHRVADAHDGTVEQVSCDESYLELFLSVADDLTCPDNSALAIAESIREEILETTQCTATVGIASNKFLAKLAADHVKPNKSMIVDDYRSLLESLKLRDLHGIGYRMEDKLAEENLVSVRDVWELGDHGESELVRILGPGLGRKIAMFCQGKDDRPVKAAERKTIGAECNYGVRFDGAYGVQYMVEGLAKEVQKRMQGVGVKGSRVTLKVKQRKQGAKPPPKFLGHGSCHNLSKSGDTSVPTDESRVISRVAMSLLEHLDVPKEDIRGMGIIVSKLVNTHTAKDSEYEPSGRITSWFGKSTTKPTATDKINLSRRSLNGTFDDIGDNANADLEQTSEVPLLPDSLPGDASSSYLASNPSVSRTSNRPQIQTKESPSLKVGRDAMGDENEDKHSVIALSQFGQDSPSEESFYCHRNEMDDDDIALPSFSQIHMSQVAELPSPMRKNIIERVSIGSSHETLASKPRKGAPPTKRNSDGGKRPPARHINNVKEGGGMKQPSIKRMMKLAAIKSGTDNTLSESLGGAVSLTQLECLPLEMQLQVANDEEIFSGYQSPEPGRKKRRRSSPNARSSATDTKAVANQGLEEVARPQQLLIPLEPLASFYQENVVPLKIFMDTNPEADVDASSKVQEFLCICINERRFSDAVKLLRSIKNRNDSWSGNVYKDIVKSANEQTRSVLGRPLDLEGLGLL